MNTNAISPTRTSWFSDMMNRVRPIKAKLEKIDQEIDDSRSELQEIRDRCDAMLRRMDDKEAARTGELRA